MSDSTLNPQRDEEKLRSARDHLEAITLGGAYAGADYPGLIRLYADRVTAELAYLDAFQVAYDECEEPSVAGKERFAEGQAIAERKAKLRTERRVEAHEKVCTQMRSIIDAGRTLNANVRELAR